MVHTEICRGNFSALREHEETAGCLTTDTQREGGVVRCVVDVVNGARDERCLSAKHIEGRFGESVVNVSIVGHVDAQMAGVVSEFKVEPDASHVAGALVGRHGIEPKDWVVKGGFHSVLHGDAGRKSSRRDFDGG